LNRFHEYVEVFQLAERLSLSHEYRGSCAKKQNKTKRKEIQTNQTSTKQADYLYLLN